MKVPKWLFALVLVLLVYVFFGLIHADNTKDAAFGNFLDRSAKIVAALLFLGGVLGLIFQPKGK